MKLLYYLRLYKANATDTEALCLDLHLSIANVFDLSKISDRDDFDVVYFPWFWMVTSLVVLLSVYTFRSYMYLGLLESEIIITDFSVRNK